MTDSEGTDGKAWVEEHIVSRVERGRIWHEQFKNHIKLAKDSRYIRILGRGFRPVSIDDINPCGHLKDKYGNEIKSCPSLMKEVFSQAKAAKSERPGADKPEHRLQAFLIRSALQNEFQFGRFHRALPDFSDKFDELIFITDELAVKPGKEKDECRADIVALGGKDGRYFPVFIELKNERLLDELKGQLTNAENWLWKREDARRPFSQFLSAVSGVPHENINPNGDAAKKMLIWPKSRSGREDKRVNEAREEGFLIVDFETTYEFIRKPGNEPSKG